MNTRLLKTSEMKQFYNWMNKKGDPSDISKWFLWMSPKAIEKAFEKQQEIAQRDRVCYERKKLITTTDRWSYSQKLLDFIIKRNEK